MDSSNLVEYISHLYDDVLTLPVVGHQISPSHLGLLYYQPF